MVGHGRITTRRLMAVACAGLLTFGSLLAFLGATLPELRARLGFDMARSGTLFSFLFLPQIPMSFVAGPLIDRFGKKPILVLGSLTAAAALLGIGLASSYKVLAALVCFLGLGASFVNSSSNTLVPDLYPENPSSAMNLGNVFFSLGAVFFPLVVTLFSARLGLTLTMGLIALFVALPGVLALLQTFPPALAGPGFKWDDVRKATLDPSILSLAVVLLFYSALETSTGGWLRIYAEQAFGASARVSGLILTAFFGSMMVGRLAASFIAKKLRGSWLVMGSAVGALLGLVLLSLAPDIRVATGGAVICGLFYGPIFPTTAGTASTYFPRIFGTVFGILMVVAFTGSMALPLAIGYIAKDTTVRNGIWMIAASAVLLVIAQCVFVVHERRRFLRIVASG